ncbi:uncharacterized protein M421DRAFT_125394 [Didymella exigua CBS 183.55]|uniref:Uncharacterized protein n=1 Tax=Didymella exigua CBS 183.55 TaxID=1150837 RepID=A0A6A5RRF4_9PLEO|nr:uncharacterized protein M421DRAFT_125394 [Didymella exigua CBS 183.55]KAF1929634.1 hypothetical protein M421DRAFT_125394 [Didymella exigua CBS 183.55]
MNTHFTIYHLTPNLKDSFAVINEITSAHDKSDAGFSCIILDNQQHPVLHVTTPSCVTSSSQVHPVNSLVLTRGTYSFRSGAARPAHHDVAPGLTYSMGQSAGASQQIKAMPVSAFSAGDDVATLWAVEVNLVVQGATFLVAGHMAKDNVVFSEMIGNMRVCRWLYPTLERAPHVGRMPICRLYRSFVPTSHQSAQIGNNIISPTSKTPCSSKVCCCMRRLVVWRSACMRCIEVSAPPAPSTVFSA